MPDSSNDANLGPDAPHRTRGTRLRDGPLFVSTAFVIAIVGALVASVLVMAVFAVRAALTGERSTGRLVEATQSPAAIWITLIASQAVGLAIALLACPIVAASPRDRLGLTAPAIRRRDAVILLVATIVPVVIGLLAASVMPSFGGDSTQGLKRMWAEGTRTMSVLWVLTIALVPGLVEEVFYRGFVLRGFQMRWRPLPAIFASSALFSLAHLDPAHAALTFVVGIWFGVVAWRTGSVVLPILMHAGMNGSWTTIQMIAARSPVGDDTATIASVITIGVGAAAFLLAIRVLRRSNPQAYGPRVAPRSPMRSVALVGVGLAGVAALLFLIIPPGAIKPGIDGTPAPTALSLGEHVGLTIACPLDGEVSFELRPGSVVRVELPTNRVGVQDVIVALDATFATVWLAYEGAVSGKKVGAGIMEQLRDGDPTVVLMRLDAGPSGLKVRFSLLQDQVPADAAWARAASEDGWATRGRR